MPDERSRLRRKLGLVESSSLPLDKDASRFEPGRKPKVTEGIHHRADFLRRPADAGLWRTSRPISPFSNVGQGHRGHEDQKLGCRSIQRFVASLFP
jgi:hypothetical protein